MGTDLRSPAQVCNLPYQTADNQISASPDRPYSALYPSVRQGYSSQLSNIFSSALLPSRSPTILLSVTIKQLHSSILPGKSLHLRSELCIYRPVSYTHLRAHETDSYLVCRLLLEKK